MTRVRRGRGFQYFDELGKQVRSASVLERVRMLAIPPAWKDVWICPHENGHLQATGIDSAGRKQYLYHPSWRERRDQQKFDEMIDFARSLPHMRRKVSSDLRRQGMARDRVLACAVRLLDCGLFRIGSESYAEENESFGLATMRRDHVRLEGDTLYFDFTAKGGQERSQEFIDAEAGRIVAELKGRRGGSEELLAYKNGKRWVDVTSSEINEYLKVVSRGDFSAKDFRTWSATVFAAVALAGSSLNGGGTKSGRKRAINEAIKGVAHFLGNTPSVARTSYIDPRVFDRYLSGWTIDPALADDASPRRRGHPSTRRAIDKAVLDLLTERTSPGVKPVP